MKKLAMSIFAALFSTSVFADSEKSYYRDNNNNVVMHHMKDEDFKVCVHEIRGTQNESYIITNNSRNFVFLFSETVVGNHYDVMGSFMGMIDFYNSNGQLIGNYPLAVSTTGGMKNAVVFTDMNVMEYLLTARPFDTLVIGFTPHNEKMSFKREIQISKYMSTAVTSYLDCVLDAKRYAKYGEDRVYD